MGKLKTKYPLEIEVDFMLFLETSELIRESYLIELLSGNLEFEQLKGVFEEFMTNHQILYEAYMFFQPVHADREQLIHLEWSLSVSDIEDNNRYIMIKVKSHTQHLKETLYQQISQVSDRITKIELKLSAQASKQEQQIKSPHIPMLHHHASSFSQVSIPADKDLDIGVLFSQPIFDQKKHKEANMPVDFRSQLQRLYSALNNSYKPEITVECQIATKQHLKHLLAYKKPKILHIICHGSKDGELQFEDDSKYSIGALSLISSQKIRMILEEKKDSMPSLVFINSCHSEMIGKIFYEAGAKYCIMIDSQDKIDDQAAQIFSQNFYRNIFRGEKVGTAFRQAKDTVKLKHNSSGCCCRHTARQKHKQNCRWLQLCQTIGEYEAHKIYHIPSQKCVCQLRSINQHDLTCEWAQFTLFHINNDFRIKDGATERFPKSIKELPKYLPVMDRKKPMLLICCCFNFQDEGKVENKSELRIPHSESNKFKMLPANSQYSQPLYQLQKNVAFRTQIIDYSAPELTQYYEKVQNSSVMGRQQELYQFMKIVKDSQLSFYFLYGHPGIGKTTFAIKASTYLIERRVFEIYFFVDLYDIKDRDMFRNKFNEVTKFDYPLNKSSLLEIKTKQMIIVFDNIDEFFLSSVDQFQQQLQNLKKEFIHTKFILTCKQKNISVLESQPIFMNNHSLIRQLKVLDANTASKALYMKIRNYLDISISYLDIRQIVEKKPELQIPKIIQNLTHSFSHTKKVKLQVLKQKVNELGQGDLAFNKLVQENLNILKARCKMSYQMLIFISQFSQGIDKNDFSILGSYDRNDKGDSYGAFIDIPIDKNWKKRLANLFQKHKETNSDASKTDSESQTLQSHVSLQKRQTTLQREESNLIVEDQNMFEGQSYFLQELSRNRYIVKRFIRDFIWNKDKSEQNYYMKHIFVAYTAVMLDIYLNFLVSQNYIHEELLEYSDISQCGIFKFKDNNYKKPLLTESIRYVEDYNSKFERILKQQPALREKIKNSDPSVFIMNHKLDFLHIYGYDWTKVYQYLYQNKKKEASILFNYLQRLIILIPTAMKVANMEETLIKYSIRQSITLLNQIRRFSKPAHTLMLTLKLKLMKTASEIEKGDDACLPNMQFQKDFHKTDLQGLDPEMLKSIQKQWSFENEILLIYLLYQKIKKESKSLDNQMKTAERITQSIRNLQQLNSNSTFEAECQCEILVAKRQLLQAMIYNKILEVSVKCPTNLKIANFKNNTNLTTCIKQALSASSIFYDNRMMKLAFRAKLLAVSINWEQLKTRVKQNQFSRQLERQRTMLRQCQELYQNKNNNLIGLTIFDGLMKKIRKEMKEKMWQDSANNLVMMKALPLSNKNTPLLQNVVRNKQKYRRQLQSIFLNAEIDLSIKFQILSAEKLAEQTKRQSTILLLTTSFRVVGGKVYLICQDLDLKQKDVEINAQFYQKYPIYNTKLLILMGTNANQGFKKLTNLFPQGPSIIAITSNSTSQFDEFQQFNYEDLYNKKNSTQLRKVIQHNIRVEESEIDFAKIFIKSMINLKNYQQGIKDIYAELWHQNKQNYQRFKIEIRESSKDIIKMIKGSFKDLSPSFRKTHNIDYELKSTAGNCIYRKWKQINEVFKQFASKKQNKYIQICGSNGVGKTTFIQEIGRMCIQRNFFQRGVYIINGKQVQQKNKSDFESYIIKASQNSNMFNLQSFNKYANSDFLLMIDDFHLIRPRSNGRYNLFLKKLIEKKVNVIFVTHQNFNMRDLLPSISIKTIKIQKLSGVQLDIYAYHVFRAQNTAAMEQYEIEKSRRPLNCPEIVKINEKNLQTKHNNFLKMPDQTIRKLTSNRL